MPIDNRNSPNAIACGYPITYWCHPFSKSSVLKMLPSSLKSKVDIFKFLLFQECFRKATFSYRISVDGR